MKNSDLMDIQYYKENPEKFVEDYYGIKLLPYQRLFLKVAFDQPFLIQITQCGSKQCYFETLNIMAKILYNENSISSE